MKEIVSPIIKSNRHIVSTFVTTFAAAAIALPIALTIVPTKTPVKADTISNGITSTAADPSLGSCTVNPGTGSGSGSVTKAAGSTVTSTVPGGSTSTTTGLVNVNPGTTVSTGSDLVHVHDLDVNALNGVNVLNNPNVSVPNASALNGLLGSSPITAGVNALSGVAASLLN